MVSPETIVVVIFNGITATIAAASVLIVVWQAPHKRTNQSLAIMMAFLAFYSILNALSRFLEGSILPVSTFWYLLLEMYGLFSFMTLLFTLFFIDARGQRTQIFLAIMMGIGILSFVVLQLGLGVNNFRPNGGGSFTFDPGPLFFLTAIATVGPTGSALWLALRADKPQGRVIAPALICILIGYLSSFLRPLIGNIPLNAIMLTTAALIIGQAVLREQLFNPLSALNTQLAQKNRELAEAGLLKNQFLAGMSYELRIPLNSIIGYTGLVIDGTYGPVNEKQHNRLDKVINNSHHLLTLIDDILDLGRIEAGRLVLNRAPIAVSQVIDQVLAVIEPMVAKKQLMLHTDIAADLPDLVVDVLRTRQILTNVLANAVKFTQQGQITIRVAQDSATYIRFEIEDTGIGIPADQQSAVFEEFRQVDGSATRQYEGTGLGLTITQRLVTLHGGRIWLTSILNQGTTVYFTLPTTADPIHAMMKSNTVTADLL